MPLFRRTPKLRDHLLHQDIIYVGGGNTKSLLGIWREKKKTVLFVTHSVEEAVYLSERVVVMTTRPGRIKSVIELMQDYPRLMESPELVTLRAKLWSEIRDESLRAMGES